MRRALRYLAVALLLAGWFAAATAPKAPDAARQRMDQAATPAGFVYVPGGECWIGSDDPDAEDADRPCHRVFIASFYIGRCEVTHAEWKRFRPDHAIPPGYERMPITNVSRQDAQAYCRWLGGRLPTDLEWEKAARGTDGRRYPWGNDWDPARCNMARKGAVRHDQCTVPGFRRGLEPAESHLSGASPYGALNMAGNAWEWVADNYGGDPQRGIIRGGAVGYGEMDARTYHHAIEGTGVT